MANNILKIRKEIGMSRAELSRRSGVSARTIEEWERERKIPSDVYLLEKVARALKCTIYELINFDEHFEKEFLNSGLQTEVDGGNNSN